MGSGAAEVSSCTLTSYWSITETVEDAPAADGEYVTSKAFNRGSQSLGPSSTPPVTTLSADTWVLDEAGEATIDLTDCPGTQGNVGGTGLKVQAIRIHGGADNGALTVSPGASNPYALFGAGNSIELPAGFIGPLEVRFDDTLDDITDVSGVGASQIDLVGTPGDEFKIEILMG